MKKSILLLAVIVAIFASCGDDKSGNHTHNGEDTHQHAPNTHQHDDGSTHKTHEHEDGSIHDHHDSEHHQEEFKVKGDSINELKESHLDKKGEEHDHGHEHGHDHEGHQH